MSPSSVLTKTKFCIGLQCRKRLFWTVHEPDAAELVPDPVTQYRFDVGREVGLEARTCFPGGVLIAAAPWEKPQALRKTAEAMEAGAPAIFEAAFETAVVHVRVDILERSSDGWNLVEVKSSTKVKDEHLPDLAVQWATLRASGVALRKADLMHLNKACRHPDLKDLFTRTDCTQTVRDLLPTVQPAVESMRRALESSTTPPVSTGQHCFAPHECPFIGRCWPETGEHPIAELHGLRLDQRLALEASGMRGILDLSEDFTFSEIQRRQVRALRSGVPVTTPSLERKLSDLQNPIFFLDFETFSPAIPRYVGTRPYDQVPVQFSVHILRDDLRLDHVEYLDETSEPRTGLAERLLEVLGEEGTIVTYATFERAVIRKLAEAVPVHSRPLLRLLPRIWDLHRVIQAGIYHPQFKGSFGLKAVYPALCRGTGYADLEISGGEAAAACYAELVSPDTSPLQREKLRRRLLDYCRLDTKAMVEIYRALREYV